VSVTIHQDAIDKLLQGPEVARFVEGKAQRVVARAQENITTKIMVRVNFAPEIAANVGYTMLPDGSAVIGIRESGSRSPKRENEDSREKYLADKEAREGMVWLEPAVAWVFDVA